MADLVKIAGLSDKINRNIGHIVSWLALGMVVLMFFNVISRYLFNLNLIWQQELVMFMHAALFLAAGGYTLLEDKHVRVDIFYQKMSVKKKALIDLLGTLFLMLPVCFAISYLSFDFVASSWHIREASPEYNGMHGVYLLKSCIFIFTASIILQSLSIIISSIIRIKG